MKSEPPINPTTGQVFPPLPTGEDRGEGNARVEVQNRAILQTNSREQSALTRPRAHAPTIRRSILPLLLSIVYLLSSIASQAATVTGYAHDISLNNLPSALAKLSFTPTNTVLVTSSGLSAGPTRTIDLTNGNFSIVLDGGDYTVRFPLIKERAAFTISVPTGTNTYNITNLLSAPQTYTYTNNLDFTFKTIAADAQAGFLADKITVSGGLNLITNTNAGVVTLEITNTISSALTNGLATILYVQGLSLNNTNLSLAIGAALTNYANALGTALTNLVATKLDANGGVATGLILSDGFTLRDSNHPERDLSVALDENGAFRIPGNLAVTGGITAADLNADRLLIGGTSIYSAAPHDGVTPANEILQAELDSMTSGGTLNFLPAVYLFTNTVAVTNSGVIFNGAGNQTVFRFSNDQITNLFRVALNTDPTDYPIMEGNGFRNLSIESSVQQTNSQAVYMRKVHRPFFENVRIGVRSSTGSDPQYIYDAVLLDGASEWEINHVSWSALHKGLRLRGYQIGHGWDYFAGYGGHVGNESYLWGKPYVEGSVGVCFEESNVGGVRIDGNSNISHFDDGIRIEGTVRELFLNDCFVDDVGRHAFYMAANSGGSVATLDFDRCWFVKTGQRGVTGHGIYFEGTGGFNLRNSRLFFHAGPGSKSIAFDDNSSGVMMQNNEIGDVSFVDVLDGLITGNSMPRPTGSMSGVLAYGNTFDVDKVDHTVSPVLLASDYSGVLPLDAFAYGHFRVDCDEAAEADLDALVIPVFVNNRGVQLTFTKVDATANQLEITGAGTISGAVSVFLTNQWQSITLQAINSTDWIITAEHNP